MEVEIAPLRSLKDFLTDARFEFPTGDANRASNRIINNLLYYQTNYFVMAVGIFLMVGYFYPLHMLTALLITSITFIGFVQFTNNKQEWKRFKSQHPIVSLLAIAVVVYFIQRLLGALVVFFMGITLPVFLIVLHSSLRLRNVSNKISRFKEYVGLKRSPMGVILESLGQEQEAGS